VKAANVEMTTELTGDGRRVAQQVDDTVQLQTIATGQSKMT